VESDADRQVRSPLACTHRRPCLTPGQAGRAHAGTVEPAIYSLPQDDAGLPVLSPFQQRIETQETLQVLCGQLHAEPRCNSRELQAVLRNVDVLLADDE